MTWSSRAQFQNLLQIASSSLTTSYQLLGTTTAPCVMFACKNGTNGDVLVSFDGTNAKLGFPASSGSAYDVETNSPNIAQLMLPENTPIYVEWNGSAPESPTGNFYVELMQVVTL